MVDVIRSRRGYPDNNHNHWVAASDLEFNKRLAATRVYSLVLRIWKLETSRGFKRIDAEASAVSDSNLHESLPSGSPTQMSRSRPKPSQSSTNCLLFDEPSLFAPYQL